MNGWNGTTKANIWKRRNKNKQKCEKILLKIRPSWYVIDKMRKMEVLVIEICNSNCLYYQDFQSGINKYSFTIVVLPDYKSKVIWHPDQILKWLIEALIHLVSISRRKGNRIIQRNFKCNVIPSSTPRFLTRG